jgi:hypothetical protein
MSARWRQQQHHTPATVATAAPAARHPRLAKHVDRNEEQELRRIEGWGGSSSGVAVCDFDDSEAESAAEAVEAALPSSPAPSFPSSDEEDPLKATARKRHAVVDEEEDDDGEELVAEGEAVDSEAEAEEAEVEEEEEAEEAAAEAEEEAAEAEEAATDMAALPVAGTRWTVTRSDGSVVGATCLGTAEEALGGIKECAELHVFIFDRGRSRSRDRGRSRSRDRRRSRSRGRSQRAARLELAALEERRKIREEEERLERARLRARIDMG